MAAITIGEYLIRQLERHGVQHVFGVPGDYSLIFLDTLVKSPLQFINTCDEQGAGFAADGYARVKGLGAVCITYAVGGLKVANATAQAYVERSPVVVICGAPGVQERVRHPLIHHRVNQFDTQLRVFQQLTAASATLDNPETAFAEIDRVLHVAERRKLPVYLELPRDMVHTPGQAGHTHHDAPETSDEDALREAVGETVAMLAAARQPVIIAGIELTRFGLHAELNRLAEQTNIPVAASLQGKSVMREDHPQYLGLYAGAVCSQEVRDYVESSDCLLMLGTQLSDMNLGMFTARLDRNRMILANTDGVVIRHHSYGVRMQDFLGALLAAPPEAKAREPFAAPCPYTPFTPEAGQPLTVQRLFQRLQGAVHENTVLLADIGDALFGSLEIPIRREGRYLAAAYYSNMGFAVPGSIGAQIADPRLRPLVLLGDGSFLMTGMEVSTSARYGLNPIVVVLNNHGYATERFFLDGPFNDIPTWEFHRIPEILGTGRGFLVRTEDELDAALQAAEADTGGFSLLDVHLPPGDVSAALHRLSASLQKSVGG